MIKKLTILIMMLLLFPIILPELDDRSYACNTEQFAIGERINRPDFGAGLELNDGIGGRRFPQTKGPKSGNIVFGDGEHGVLVELCNLTRLD